MLFRSDQKDRRCHRVMLTPMALEKKQEILDIAQGWQETLLKNLSEDDQQSLLELCRKILDKN